MPGVEEIEVGILPDGRVTLRVRGAAGDSCRELTADLERALGNVVLARDSTGSESTEEVKGPSEVRVTRTDRRS